MIKVKLVRSLISCNPTQRATVAALGLRKIGSEKTFKDDAAIRGMINKVKHLVEVSE